MPIEFPTPTSVGQQFSSGGKTWQWNGFAWNSIANASALGATGATGLTLTNIPPINSSSTYTLEKSDAGKIIIKTTGNDVYINAGNNLSAGDVITIYNNSIQACQVIPGAATTLRLAGAYQATGNRFISSGALVTILCLAENEYVIMGAGIS